MKKFIILILLCWISLGFSETVTFAEVPLSVNLIESNDNRTVMEYSIGEFSTLPVTIDEEIFNHLFLKHESNLQQKGDPALPKITRSIIIPDRAAVNVNILASSFREFNLKIAPSKGIIPRNIDPDSVPYEFSDVYTRDEFYPADLTAAGTPYILRDFRGVTVTVFPFSWNPVTEVLRVYTHLVLEVSTSTAGNINIRESRPENRYNIYFSDVYRNHFLNFATDRYPSVNEQGRCIVISYGNFLDEMQPYVDWKNQKGIQTDIYNVSTIGSTAIALKNFIQNEYNADDGLVFVQLVGDAAQIPTFTSGGGGADPLYALLEGNDSYPDIFVGRFSAETEAQVVTQVDRSIHYERDLNNGSWLHSGTGIASSQGAGMGDDGEADWVHMDVIRDKLLAYNYTAVDRFYDTLGSTATDVGNALNQGRSIIDYCGHGSTTSWSSTGFSNSHINALTNDYKLPVIFSVACVNGNFTGTTCFAETWLRATNNSNGNPTGAIAVFASSINQSWAPPMQAQDEFIDLLCGAGPYAGLGNQFNTVGGLWFNSEGQMLDESNATDMYETWHIFGDASLQVRNNTPEAMSVSHDPSIFVGQSNFAVSTDTPDALVCLYDGTSIVAAGFTNGNGGITLSLNPVPSTPGELSLTVTAYNKITSIETVSVIDNEGPYVVLADYLVHAGSDDLIESGESVQLDFTLENIGSDPATNVTILISSSDPYITVTDPAENFGNLSPSGSASRTAACSFNVDSYIPHDHSITLDLLINCEENSWNVTINLSGYNPPAMYTVTTSFDETLLPNSGITRILTLENPGGADLDYTIEIVTDRSIAAFQPINSISSLFSVSGDRNYADKILPEFTYPYTSRSYCSASGGCDEYISNVAVGSINNSSSCSGYADYTGYSTDMTIGESYSITVSNGNTWIGDQCDIHIDWNQDEDFYDSGETITMNGGPTTFTATITPPETATPGNTRMRLRLRYYGDANPCGSYTYGEVEDYTLNILPAGPLWITANGELTISGTIPAQSSAHEIDVEFNSNELDIGIYTADLIISSNDPENSEVIIPVTLTVDDTGDPQPEIEVSVSSISQNLDPEGTASQQFTIMNSGDPATTLTWSILWDYASSRLLAQKKYLDDNSTGIPQAEYNRLFGNTQIFRDEDWLSVNPISGDCRDGESDIIQIDFDSADLIIGSYNATITISHNSGSDVTIPVSLTVSEDIPASGVRSIAEFEQMEGVLIRYPFGLPLDLIAEMSEDVMVTTIVANSTQESTVLAQYSSNGVNTDNCNFLIAASDSYWTRDYGPWFVETAAGEIGVVDFTYNRPRPNDNNIPAAVASQLAINYYFMDIEHAGGNYMTDGMGIAASSHIVYDENEPMTESQVDQMMLDFLGITDYHVVQDPNGTYINHIDCWGKFLDVDKVLIRSVPPTHSQYDELENTAAYFAGQLSSYGTQYNVYRVYTPDDQPYTNSLILNNKVFVPQMNSSWDDDALAVYQQAMPGYEVLGFTGNWESTDALHCRAKGIADRDMLRISHIPLNGSVDLRSDFLIEASISPCSDQPLLSDSLLIHYRVNDGLFQTACLNPIGEDLYQGYIPAQPENAEIEYYLRAVDNAFNSANHPLIGHHDPHFFQAGTSGLSSPANLQIVVQNGRVFLSWDSNIQATGYRIYRSTEPDSGFSLLNTTQDTFYEDAPPDSQFRYFYRVTSYTE